MDDNAPPAGSMLAARRNLRSAVLDLWDAIIAALIAPISRELHAEAANIRARSVDPSVPPHRPSWRLRAVRALEEGWLTPARLLAMVAACFGVLLVIALVTGRPEVLILGSAAWLAPALWRLGGGRLRWASGREL